MYDISYIFGAFAKLQKATISFRYRHFR